MTTPRNTESASSDHPGKGGAHRQGGPSSPPAGTPREPDAVPRAGAPRSGTPDPGAGWSQGADGGPPEDRNTVLPGGRAPSASGRPAQARPAPPRPAVRTEGRPSAGGARTQVGRSRRARLALKRVDPWSVFLFSLVASVFVGIALVVAVAVLYAVLGSLGVTESVNELVAEVTDGSATPGALLTSGRVIGGAAVLAVVNVVFLTLLATLGAMLYNLCASFTGGIELTLGERD